MVIVASCESCKQKYALPPEAAGETKTCRQCGKSFQVPGGFNRLVPKPDKGQSPPNIPKPKMVHSGKSGMSNKPVAYQWMMLGVCLMLALVAGLTVDRFRSVDAPTSRQFAVGYATPAEDEERSLAEQVFDDAVPSVVLISAFDAQGRMLGRGTGFFLHPGDRLVTCAHVIDDLAKTILETNLQQ